MVELQVDTYGGSDLESVAKFAFDKSNTRTLIFIHGGAWRDPSNTWNDFNDMAKYVHEMGTSSNIFSINYRLSPAVKHPSHIIDVLRSIYYISKTYEIKGTEIALAGHSVGATLILQLLSCRDIIKEGLKESKNKNFIDTEIVNYDIPQLIDNFESLKLSSLFLIDGIYDIESLLKEYPDYMGFVKDAFVSDRHYKFASQLSSNINLSLFDIKNIKVFILQSLDDELLSRRQSDEVHAYFKPLSSYLKFFVGHWGTHEQVYQNKEVSTIIGQNLQTNALNSE